MQRLRMVTWLDVSTVAGHHVMPASLLLISYHPKPVLDLVYIWYDYRFCFKISFSTIPIHVLT